jgi:hypothetical protein
MKTFNNEFGDAIQISDDGLFAKVTFDYDSSDWMPIEQVWNEDKKKFIPTIDPDGYNIPLDHLPL